MFDGPRQRPGVQHDASTDCDHGRKLANDEAVTWQQQQGISEVEVGKGSLSGRDLFLFMEHDLGDGFRGIDVQVDAGMVLQRFGGRQKG